MWTETMIVARVFFILFASFIYSANAMDSEVVLNSSVSSCGRLTVCPNETVLFECFVVGERLVWILPGLHQVYNQSNNTETNVLRNIGPASVWLSNNKQLKSQLVLSYSPHLNNAEVQCNSPTIFKNITYILSGTPDKPQLTDPKIVGQGDSSSQYLLEWSVQNNALNDLDYYEVSVSGNKATNLYSFVSAHDNKVIISADEGVESKISVVAVNKCAQRSKPSEKTLKPMNHMPSKQSHGFVIYLVTALAITFCLVSLFLLIVIFMFVLQKLRLNKKGYQASKNEGFPLLRTKESNRDSS